MHCDFENSSSVRDKAALDETQLCLLPREFTGLASVSSRQPVNAESSVFFISALVFLTGFFTPFFTQPFLSDAPALRAVSLAGGEAMGFVTFMDALEENSGAQMKDVFGWGGLDLVSRASQALAPHLQACRAQLQGSASGLSFRFDVKVDVNKPGFTVSGLLDGAEREPAMATCLRDKINSLAIADFKTLRSAAPKSYKLRLGVQMAHGADGGAP
ncbi:MAG: hypothetical protein FJY29_08035 [Betaproteobacteria bacterium]|nr:hypothetical protein [Betaproteobacteria bacterium]